MVAMASLFMDGFGGWNLKAAGFAMRVYAVGCFHSWHLWPMKHIQGDHLTGDIS